MRVDQVGGVERCAACLALVAVGFGVVAMRTFAGDLAVGEELDGFGVVELHGSFRDGLAVLV